MAKLIDWDIDYADEFDVVGFIACTDKQYEKMYQDSLDAFKEREESYEDKSSAFPIEIYFGTNEAITFESQEDYFNSFQVESISDEELKVLQKIFGGSLDNPVYYGTGNFFPYEH